MLQTEHILGLRVWRAQKDFQHGIIQIPCYEVDQTPPRLVPIGPPKSMDAAMCGVSVQ